MIEICTKIHGCDDGGTPPVCRTFSQVVGDGSTSSFTLTHNLGKLDVFVLVRTLATGVFVMPVQVTAVNENVVTVVLPEPPVAGGARITLLSV